jgi:hypothetical protein
MITIATTEKWIEFSNLENPIKAEFDRIWLSNIDISRRGNVTIKCVFGKIEQRLNESNEPEPYFNPSQYGFEYSLSKTDEEVKGYGYDQLHTDAKAILETICLSQATFTIS